jgi:hypothetical protein
MTFFDSSIRIKIVTIYKNFFGNHDFSIKFFKSVVNRKKLEPEPQFVSLAPGGHLISTPRFRLHNTAKKWQGLIGLDSFITFSRLTLKFLTGFRSSCCLMQKSL